MGFKDLGYKKPKGMVKDNGRKQRGRNTGKNIQRLSDSVPEASDDGSGHTGNG